MAHALATHLRQRDLDAAFLADDAAELHPLVLAAQALIVLDRAKDAGTEQAVALRLECAIVDRLRLLDLAVRPAPDLLRARDLDLDLIESHCLASLAKDLHQLVHANTPCGAVTPASLSPRKRGAGVQSLPRTSIRGLGPRFRGDDE